MLPINKEELLAIIERLVPLYPERVQEATNILLEEYKLPMHLAIMIMTLVRMKVDIQSFYIWPKLDATRLLFGVN